MTHLRFAAIGCTVALGLVATADAQEQFRRLAKSHFPVQPTPSLYQYEQPVGDLNGDGFPDVAWLDYTFLNDGDGRFREGPRPGGIVVVLGDVDADGDLDGFTTGNPIELLLNDGSARFVPAGPSRLPVPPVLGTPFDVADVDVDGDLDLLAQFYHLTGPTADLWLNDGSGAFVAAPAGHIGVPWTGLARFVDVDGDGDPDLVGVTSAGGRVDLNDGTGRFTPSASTLPLPAGTNARFVMADFDLAHGVDLLFYTTGQAILMMNDGNGAFVDKTVGELAKASPGYGVAVVDANADGLPDLVLGSGPVLYLNLSGGLGGTRWFYAQPASALPPALGLWIGATAVDLDRDGREDLFSPNGHVWFGQGAASYRSAFDLSFPLRPTSSWKIAWADVDLDGDIDAWLAGSGGGSRLLLNDGDGKFEDAPASWLPYLATFVSSAAFGDVDGDGDPDLLVGTNYLRRPDHLLINDGHGRFVDASARLPVRSVDTARVRLGDVDGDGDLDALFLVATPSGASEIHLSTNDGRGDLRASRLVVAAYVTDVLLVDLNGDAAPDILGLPFVWLNDGRGGFTQAPGTIPVASGIGDFSAGDVDGDGDLDLLLANRSNQQPNALVLNDGRGNFRDVTATQMPVVLGTTLRARLVDLDEDGDLDGLLDEVAILNDGSGTFRRDTGPRILSRVYGVSAGMFGAPDAFLDLDGDGDGDPVRDTFVMGHNLHRHAHAPFLARPGRPYTMQVFARPGYGTTPKLAIGAVSLGRASIPLGPYGTWRIDPTTSISYPPLLITPATGQAEIEFRLPRDPGLVGLALFSQFLILDPEGRSFVTNVVGDRIY